MPDYAIGIERGDDDHTTIYLTGESDVQASAEVRSILAAIVEERPRRITVDVATVDYVDSTALGVLVSARKRALASDVSFRLRSPTPLFHRLLHATGLADTFHIDTESEE